ncbi:ImmA/IrrE family metallo-endopeptidase [Facklamia sp. P12950]|uniref:ImmA/IrrE family metallo-endopeptidase n=1 Tax=Facklamia sp. P12950 TaxID=3421951 RepID=UPI003D177C9E
MNAFEKLLAEFDNELTFVFDKDIPDKLPGLICDKTVYLNKDLPFDKAICVLSEEIGHYKTSTPKDITDYRFNGKEERKARNWGYKKLVPIEKLKNFIVKKESVMPYELAEEFGITEEVAEEAVQMYRVKGELD